MPSRNMPSGWNEQRVSARRVEHDVMDNGILFSVFLYNGILLSVFPNSGSKTCGTYKKRHECDGEVGQQVRTRRMMRTKR
jgi:hypothetical protein